MLQWLLPALVAGCSFSFTLSIFQVIGRYLEASQPVSLVLVGIVGAVVGAAGGSIGTLTLAVHGWNARWRTLEAVGLIGAAALVVYGVGGFEVTAGGALRSLVIPLAPLAETLVAWGVAVRLSLPIRRLAVLGMSSADETHAGAVYESLRAELFLFLTVLVAGWAALSYALRGAPDSQLAFLSGAAYVGCGLLLSATLHQAAVRERLDADQVQVDEGFGSRVPAGVVWLIAAVLVIAALLPTDVSRLHAWNFNRWMEGLTEYIGPLLVPPRAPGRNVSEQVDRPSTEHTVPPDLVNATPENGPLKFLGWLAVLAGVIWIARKVFRMKRGRVEPVQRGRLPIGFRWLFDRVKEGILWLLAQLGLYFAEKGLRATQAESEDKAGAGEKGRLKKKRDTVPAIYSYVLARLGRRGLRRRPTETPLEFLDRWRHMSGEDSGMPRRGLAALTDLYIAVRYAEYAQRPGLVQRARRAGKETLRALTRSAVAARVAAWLRRS